MENIKKSPIKMSATMAMNNRVGQLRAAGHHVYHLGFGEAKFPVHPKILSKFQEHAAARSYLPIAGLPALRENVADYYRRHFGLDVQSNQVIIGSGSKTMLFAAMHALEGDVLLPAPTWVSYETQAQLAGKAITRMPTQMENNLCPTVEDLYQGLKTARQAGQSPGILVITSPGNPTSTIYSPELLAALAEIARAENLVIISDEIYALTAYGDTPFASMACYYPEGTIVTGGLSKHLSLGGWRLGVAVVPPGEFGQNLYRYMTAVAGAVWTTAASPVQYAATVAYADDPDIDTYAATCTTIHGYITKYLYETLHALGVEAVKPEGGFYVYPSFAPWREQLAGVYNIHTSQDLANVLLDKFQMATIPGDAFGASPQDLTLRLSTSYLYAFTDDEGWNMLSVFAKGLPRDQFIQETCPEVLEVGERFKAFIESLEG
jgi:aspartate aminotransferase